jgi:hypothetical protein
MAVPTFHVVVRSIFIYVMDIPPMSLAYPSLTGEEISDANVDNFIQYISQRWVGQAHRWNVHNIDKNRTNNHMEGWHSHMNKRVKQGSNSWRFMIAIKAEQTSKELEI